jgi:phosphoglycolate phosphatase-like HAD superfamily hydrolase
MKVLALDFDGVISDSAAEAFWIALRTYLAFRPESALRRAYERCGGERQRILDSPLYQGFVDLMPLGNRAEDFGVQLAALDVGRELPDQEAYDGFYSAQEESFLADFHREFYRERWRLCAAEPRRWDALSSAYVPLLATLHANAERAEFSIATAKDRPSVLRLLSAYGVANLFAQDAIFDKEAGRNKEAHLRRIQQRFGVRFDQITFVDDKVNHLISVEKLGVRCVLAAWGYNGDREREIAKTRDFRVCGLEDVAELFEGC